MFLRLEKSAGRDIGDLEESIWEFRWTELKIESCRKEENQKQGKRKSSQRNLFGIHVS